MKYAQKSFSVAAPGTDTYRENYERIFGKKEEKLDPPKADDCQKEENDSPRSASS